MKPEDHAKATEAVTQHRKVVEEWRPKSDVWALAHGPKISCLCVAGSSYAILMKMRQFFNLYSQQSLFGTMLPVVVLPTVGYFLCQDIFLDRTLINRFAEHRRPKDFCSTCFEVRGSVIQAAAGVAAPVFISMSTCVSASLTHRTFPVPELGQVKSVTKMFRRACGSFATTLFFLTLGNVIAGGFLTQKMLEQHVLICASSNKAKKSE